MKKVLLPLIALLVLSIVSEAELSAQITQNKADSIVQERMSGETKPFTVYAKEGVQTDFAVVTATGEILELEYSCWVYYVSYAGKVASPYRVRNDANGKYLIVKENNGNLLEVNVGNDGGPENLTEWREVNIYPIEIPFTEYSLEETLCLWANLICDDSPATLVIINSNEELEQYISCAEEYSPEIDFATQTLLLVKGLSFSNVFTIDKKIQKFSTNEYKLNIELSINYDDKISESWFVAIIVSKLSEECHVALDITTTTTSGQWKNLNFPYVGDLIIINSQEDLDNHINCEESIYSVIDFSKHTLLLASGTALQTSAETVVTDFQQLAMNKYELNIRVYFGISQATNPWILPLIVKKMNETNIELLVTYVPF